MSYIAFTADGELHIEANEANEDEFFVRFFTTSVQTMVEQRTVSTGIWPFRRSETRDVEHPIKRRDWVMSVRVDYINRLVPVPEPPSE